MFVLGFHFPADMGNDISDDKVIEKLDSAVDMSGVSKVKLCYGKKFENEVEYANMNTFLAKALVHYFQIDNEAKEPKYFIYTNRYQMSEISKKVDSSDAETMKLCKLFDSMEQFKIDVA